MSKETNYLKLFKYDKDSDNWNTTTFNIKQCLNDNWDKIDAANENINVEVENNTNLINNLINSVDNSDNYINDIKKGIGTKNLIFNSNFKNGKNLWTPWRFTTITVDTNLNCIIKAATSTGEGFGILTPTLSLIKDQKYTLSFLASNYYNVPMLNYIYIVSSSLENIKLDNVSITTSGTLYDYCYLTFTAPNSIDDAKILIGALKTGLPDEGFRLRNVKIEKGIIPTDWTPAPEEITNKLDTIQTGAEVNQNAITFININNQLLTTTNKTDTISIKTDNKLKTILNNKEIQISNRISKNLLNLNIDSINGIDNADESTPFKTIQGAINYVTEYYVYLEKGVTINIPPKQYTEIINISNISNNFNNITLQSTNLSNIPLGGVAGDINDYVILNNLKINNTACLIQLNGIFLSGNNFDNIIKETAEDGKPLGKLGEINSNFNVLFYKSRIYGAESNTQNLGYFYGARIIYSKTVFQDCFLDRFNFNISGGNAAPIRVSPNSDISIINCKFGNNTYDIIGDEAVIKVRKSTRLDGQSLKTNLSDACFYKQGN